MGFDRPSVETDSSLGETVLVVFMDFLHPGISLMMATGSDVLLKILYSRFVRPEISIKAGYKYICTETDFICALFKNILCCFLLAAGFFTSSTSGDAIKIF